VSCFELAKDDRRIFADDIAAASPPLLEIADAIEYDPRTEGPARKDINSRSA
jgi:hypothetical protein